MALQLLDREKLARRLCYPGLRSQMLRQVQDRLWSTQFFVPDTPLG
jgi:hypothetical protein